MWWEKVTRNDFEALLRKLRRTAESVRFLRDRLSREEDRADHLAMELSELLEGLEEHGGLDVPQPTELRKVRARAVAGLKSAARAGALSLTISRKADGSGWVQVDGSKPFRLPPALSDLLSVLAMDGGEDTEELVGWKSFKDVQTLLKKKQGKELSRHAITQNVHRLRKALAHRAGINPYLVQTDPRYGMRFALKRRPSSAAASALRPLRESIGESKEVR